MWLGPRPNVISINFHSRGSSHMLKQSKPTVANIQNAMVSTWFCVRPTSTRWFLKNNPSDHATWCIRRHVTTPYRLHIHLAFTYSIGPSSVVWSIENLDRPHLSTNESAPSVTVTGSRSRVWSDHNLTVVASPQGPLPQAIHPTTCFHYWNNWYGSGTFLGSLVR